MHHANLTAERLTGHVQQVVSIAEEKQQIQSRKRGEKRRRWWERKYGNGR